jgi:hypothetical protein
MAEVAVITGDLVGSTRHTPQKVDAAMQAIQATAADIASWQFPPTAPRFTRFRGDGWQICLSQPRLSLRAAVVIQGRLIALGMESRISIGIGAADTLGTADLSDAAGRAFELSGHGLDQIGDTGRLAIDKDSIQVEDQLIADLLGERMGRWTTAQAEAAAMQLASPGRIRTLHEIGKQLKISPQAVNDRVRGAGCPVIAAVLRRWESAKAQQGWDAPHD